MPKLWRRSSILHKNYPIFKREQDIVRIRTRKWISRPQALVILRKQNPHQEMNYSLTVKYKQDSTSVPPGKTATVQASSSERNLDKIKDSYRKLVDNNSQAATSSKTTPKTEKAYPSQINLDNRGKNSEKRKHRSRKGSTKDKSRSPRSGHERLSSSRACSRDRYKRRRRHWLPPNTSWASDNNLSIKTIIQWIDRELVIKNLNYMTSLRNKILISYSSKNPVK